MNVSVVIPLYNEEALIPEIAQRFGQLVHAPDDDDTYECIFVDDGSRDRTLARLQEEAERQALPCTLVSFRRNFGHHHAIYAGLQQAEGAAVILIDGDLQDPPELIPALVRTLEQGTHDLVYARRLSRSDGAVKKFFSNAFYKVFNRFSKTKIPENTGIYRCLTAELRTMVLDFSEHEKFILGLMEYPGVDVGFVDYERDERKTGESKYSFWKSLQLAWLGLSSFTTFPLSIIRGIGSLVLALAFAAIVVVTAQAIMPGVAVAGWAILLAVMGTLFGLNFLCLGILGEYVGKAVAEAKQRPNFYVKSITKVNRNQS